MLAPFKFKNFTIEQDQCAMKVGTDGVLLGAWATLQHDPNSILDIGTGTGLIALQLAQRSSATLIDALEIDDSAYEQATSNFENSPWADRLFCYHASFLEFVEEMDDKYDLLVSNPPFYTEHYKTDDTQRNLARFNDSLPFEHLLFGTAQLLSENGKACFIIPFSIEQFFLEIANKYGLYINRVTRVKGTPKTEYKRSLLELSFTKCKIVANDLIIETERHKYTDAYIALTKPFYLKM